MHVLSSMQLITGDSKPKIHLTIEYFFFFFARGSGEMSSSENVTIQSLKCADGERG